MYVADRKNVRIRAFSENGKELHNWASYCYGLAVDREGLVYVSAENDTVRVFTGEGKVVREWDGVVKTNGQFASAFGLALGSDLVFVCDYGSNCVNAFTLQGQFVGRFATRLAPKHIAVSAECGDVFVVGGERGGEGWWLRRWRTERDTGSGELSWKEVDLGL